MRLLPWLLPFAGCAPPPPAVRLTTDCGVETDDQWAVAYLALLADAGEVNLRGR